MFAVCHGQASNGATHVPPALQGKISDIAVGRGVTCAIVEPDSDVVCWGSTLVPPYRSCSTSFGPTSKAEQVFVWEDPATGEMSGAMICTGGNLGSFSGVRYWSSSVTGSAGAIVQVSGAAQDLCWLRQESANSFSFFCFEQGTLTTTNAETLIFAGDGGACMKTGSTSLACFGSWSGFAPTVPPGATNLIGGNLSGNVACLQWDNGWFCSTKQNVGVAQKNLAQLWPLVTSAETNAAVGLNTVSVWSEFANTSSGVLCAVLTSTKETVCQGTGYNDVGDTSDGVFLMNAENTQNTQQIAVGPTHACALVTTETSVWIWVVFGVFVALFLLCLYLVWRNVQKEWLIKSYRVLRT